MFTFSLITPSDGDISFKAGILSFDNEFKILADPCWNGKDPNAVLFMEQALGEINAIILSHSTPEFLSGYALLWIKFPNLMATIPVYSTLPVNQLGRISTVEYYRANGILGPLKEAIIEIEDIDELFDKINVLKYLQSTTLFDGKIVMTAYNAGHTLGGTFWLITKRIDKIIYAPAWNHSKDSFLNSAAFLSSTNGSPVSSLLRPTAFITGTDIGSTMSHKKRTDKFLELVDATLANGGAVVIPTSLSGRFFEVFHLIDEHLQGAPIPVYFLSYSGTKILTYASSLVDWMVPSMAKDWDDSDKNSHSRSMPFDPSKVDLLLDPNELLTLVGPKIVFCSGIDLRNGDLSAEAFQYLCQDEKSTILLTEKSLFASDNTLNSLLYNEWYSLTKTKLNGKVEDGVAVPLETVFSIDDWTKEEPLIGGDLTEFQEKVTEFRKKKLLAKVRDKKNQNLLNSDLVDAEDSSEDEEEEEEEAANSSDEEKDLDAEEKALGATSNGASVSVKSIDELAAHEAFLADYIKESLDERKPIDLRITHRLKPRQAMFPYFPGSHKQKFDDYGEIIDIKDFQKSDEISNTKIIMEGKKKFEQNERRERGKNGDRNGNRQKKDKVNKLTPQEQLNNEIFQKYLDTLHGPKKRVKLGASGSVYASQVQQLRVRCVLSFIDLSGLVDLRSLGIIVSSLKPYNLLLLPDFTNSDPSNGEANGLQLAQSYFINQQTEQKLEENKKNLFSSSRYLSLAGIRSGLSSVSNYGSNSKMQVAPALVNQTSKIGGDIDAGAVGLSNFEINLDDSIIEELNWQTIGGSYKVAQVYGELEIHNQEQQPESKKRTVSDVINSSTQFTLKKVKQEDFVKQQLLLADKVEDSALKSVNTNGPRLAIGNIRLPDLKKKLQGLNLNAEFKSEGTLVVNDAIAIRKVAYSSIDGDDTGDIVIDGNIGPLYYKVKDSIKDMLAYV